MGISRIPMPQNGIDAFMTGMQNSQAMFDSMMKNKMTPYQIKLLEAQALEAQGKGASESMKANLLQRAMERHQSPNSLPAGIFNNNPEEPPVSGSVPPGTYAPSVSPPSPGQPAPVEPNDMGSQEGISDIDKQKISALKPGESYTIPKLDNSQTTEAPSSIPPAPNASPAISEQSNQNGQGNQTGVMENPRQGDELASEIMGLPVREETVQGYHYAKNPVTGETVVTRRGLTPQEAAELKIKTARAGAFGAQDAKTAALYDTQAMAGANTLNTLENIGKTIQSPVWKNMRTYANLPGGGKASLWWYAHNGTPEEQDLAGKFATDTGQIVANMAPMFKGQFRKGEQTLINGMKINDTDTVATAQGKYEALVTMEKFISDRSKLMSKLIRQGYSPPDASDLADKQLKGNLVRKMVDNKAGVSKSVKFEHERLKKLADEAVAKNPLKKDEILAKLALLTKEEE